MKTYTKLAGAAALLMSGLLASGSAMAQHWGHGHGGNVRFGISLGVPIYGPAYYPAPYYAYPAYAYPPLVVEPAAPPVYVERGAAEAPPVPPQADWYYCAPAQAYYPYVSDCPTGWQRVPAQPPAR